MDGLRGRYRALTVPLALLVVAVGWVVQLGFAEGRAEAAATLERVPARTDKDVNDLAGVLTDEQEAELRTLFTDVRSETDIDPTVLTIRTMKEFDSRNTAGGNIETFTQRVFDAWGIGRASTNKGAMILVAVDDRKARIEYGAGFANKHDGSATEIMQQRMLPAFRSGDYGSGIVDGAQSMIRTIAPGVAQATEADATGPSNASSPSNSDGGLAEPLAVATESKGNGSKAPIVGLSVAVAGVVAGVGGLVGWRYRPRKCDACSARLAFVDEAGDDMYLESGQQLEELLRSADYDVWKCGQCNNHELHRHARMFTRVKVCPSCSFKTVKSVRKTLVAATYSSSGSAKIIRTCANCKHQSEETVVLPRLEHTTTSSSSSFSGSSFSSGSGSSSGGGGGRSGGGGSSGSW